MTTVNKVFLIGYLGGDPEVRYTQNGDPVANFTIATTQRWKDGGEQREETEWHRIVLFKKIAEIAAEYLKKGAHVCIQGRLRTRKWQDKNGNDRYTTEVIGMELQMLGRAKGDDDRERPSGSANYRQATKPSGRGQTGERERPSDGGLSEMEDDIPF